ncbi:NXPE family member 3-like [Saccoglossus kowalevskii]|uniref:NXPE family member 3-like n=1 Tax=Saccoglossus kowalevskii TaxID=10224 RepID=A0ABM0M7G0_SACKO|nr:PREDICTED: NXPE family member 3-like [Saccoglossus kowalevskii]
MTVKLISLRLIIGIVIGIGVDRIWTSVTSRESHQIVTGVTDVMTRFMLQEKNYSSKQNVEIVEKRPKDLHTPTFNNHDKLFPYDKYTLFGMEWKSMAEEFELAYSNLNREDVTRIQPFSIGTNNFGVSSTTHSRVYFHDDTHVTKGGHIHVVIETFDKYGNQRKKGGDMFEAVMSNEKLVKSTSGRVTDYGNGTYSVHFYAAWAGEANISIFMRFTREMLQFINKERSGEGHMEWTGVYSAGRDTEEVDCKIIRDGTWEDKCSYKNRNSFASTMFVCDKPKSFTCKELISVNPTPTNVKDESVQVERKRASYIFASRQKSILASTPMKIKIKDSSSILPPLPLCGPDLPVPISDGYWTDNVTYVSLVCKSQHWNSAQIEKCLSNVSIKMFGDSTIFQLGQSIRAKYNLGDYTIEPKAYFPLGPTFFNIRLESEFLDTITKEMCESRPTVVVMNIIFHYFTWSIPSYLDRLYATRFSVERLLSRCPTVKVFLQTSHPGIDFDDMQTYFSGPWVGFDMDRMIRRVFGGMGVYFLGVSQMTSSHLSRIELHSNRLVIDERVNLLLSYICPTQVESV